MRQILLLVVLLGCTTLSADDSKSPDTVELLPQDPAASMVAGIDRFLLRKWEQANDDRELLWKQPKQLAENRKRLKEVLGLERKRHTPGTGFVRDLRPIASTDSFAVHRIRWPVLSHPAPQTHNAVGLWAEGLYLMPARQSRQNGNRRTRNQQGPSGQSLVVIIPDADESPQQWASLTESSFEGRTGWRSTFAADLASDGCEVVILRTVSRKLHQHRNAKMSRREYLHRSAFELGRTLIGYEVQMVQSLLDQFDTHDNVALCGVGEGGRTALFTSAIDERIDVTAVGNYFGHHGPLWSEPLSRQLFSIHSRYSDGCLAALHSPRATAIFNDRRYQLDLPGVGGAPATWDSDDQSSLLDQLNELNAVCETMGFKQAWSYHNQEFDFRSELEKRWPDLPERTNAQDKVEWRQGVDGNELAQSENQVANRLFASIDVFNQLLLAESPYERRDYINIDHPREDNEEDSNRVDTTSVASYKKSISRFRDDFRDNVIGWFADPLLPLNARSAPAMKGTNWQGHHIMLDVYPDVVAYGILLLPTNIAPHEKRPVVVCQHGLEGRPQDTILGDHRAYHDYAAKLAERGFIVFAPQNPYIGKDDFRTLQRKSYPLGKTLFSIIGAQHKQILNYLRALPNVDPDRIAFYGLSYGGKSAMRLPALLPEYCLSICSADFNDWVWKNASSRSRYSYIGTGEYEIFEFGLGKKFNYAEMAALIAPRPFMVERGHYDGVAPDHRVASEFAKVRFLYQARLKLKERCEIEFFDGPHTINANGTFEFLRKHLKFPES